jgi:hypothetical protein
MKQELESLGFDPGRLIMLGCEADAEIVSSGA